MPFNGSGTYVRTQDWTNDAAANIKIRADRHDSNDDDIASALSLCITRNGQSTISADIPFNGKKIVNLANPVAAQDAVTKAYVDGLRTYSTPITMTGAGANGRIKFSGATGVLGLEWTDPAVDLGFGVNTANNQFVWNDKADFSGTSLATLWENAGNTTYMLTSTLTGTSVGPYLYLTRDLNIPASGAIGGILFQGKNSASTLKSYNQIFAQVMDPTSGSEDTRFVFQGFTAGVSGNHLVLDGINNTMAGSLALSDYLTLSKAAPTGIRFTDADIGFGVIAGGIFAWNDKADMSGKSFMQAQWTGSPGSATLTLLSELTTTSNGPYVVFKRDVIPPAGANLGSMLFTAKNSAGTARNFGQIFVRADDPTNASEDSSFYFQAYKGGAFQNHLVLDGNTNVMLGGLQLSGALTGVTSLTLSGSLTGGTVLTMTGLATVGALTSTGTVSFGGSLIGTGSSIFFGGATAAIPIQFRPKFDSATNQTVMSAVGDWTFGGSGTFSGALSCGTNALTCGPINCGTPITASGGLVIGTTGANTIWLRPNGSGSATGQMIYSSAGNLTIDGSVATKATGTTWANPSDARIKNVVGDYTIGLAAILALVVKRFTYKGNETAGVPGVDPALPEDERADPDPNATAPFPDSPHYKLAVDGTECVGLIAQDAEQAMPDLVTEAPAYIDGEPVPDLRVLDTSNVIYALINAVKELAARVQTLEAAA